MEQHEHFPRFSPEEMARRWAAVGAEAERAQLTAVLVYGSDRSGALVQWLTHWPVTREAALCWHTRKDRPTLFVQFANHLDAARRMATGCEVAWGGVSTMDSVARSLDLAPGAPTRVGVLGPLRAPDARVLESLGAQLVFLDAAARGLRLVKSSEELDWVRRGAALTDAAVLAVAGHARPGTSEAELCALAEGAYLGVGATNHIHYFSSTPMRSPEARVPAQWPSRRVLQAGDVVSCEVSASWWGYAGQLLRTFSVAEPPTALYQELHAVAEAAFDALFERAHPGATGEDLAEVARLIERAGFSTCDDVVHGFVGAYLPPVVPGGGRPPAHGSFTLQEGMTIVIQPNVVSPDHMAGVQTGELVHIGCHGPERLHDFPRGIGVLGG